MDIGMIVRERDCIAEIVMCSTGTRQWLRMMTTTSTSKTTTWKVNSEPAIELASPRTRRSQRNTRVDTSCPRPEHQQHAAWPDYDRQWRGAREWASPRTRCIWRNWVDRHATVIHGPSIDDMQHGHVENGIENPWNWNWTCKSMETEWTHSVSPRPEHPYTCSMARHTTLTDDRTINYNLQPSGDRETNQTTWTENKDFGSDDEQAARDQVNKRRHQRSTTSRTTTWMTAETTTTSTKTIDHRTGILLWTVPEKWFGTVKQKCK